MTTTVDRVQSNGETVELPLTRNAVAIVPPIEMYDTYVSRNVAGKTDMEVFQYARENHVNVLIEGPTGSGKTSGSLAFAAKNKMPFYATPSSIGMEPSQLFGRYIPTGPSTYEWQDGPVTKLVRHGGLLLINEVNFVPARVATTLFSLFDKRREIQLLDHKGEVIKAHEDLLIVADMNPDYRGTQPLNAALRNRFGIQMYWDYDPAIERKLVKSTELVALAVKMREAEELSTPISTNMLVDFMIQAKGPLGWQFASSVLVNKFSQDERPVVQQMLMLHETQLKRQILKSVSKKSKTVVDDSPEWNEEDYDLTVVGTPDNPNPINHPDWTLDMGIYNVDWNIEVTDDEDDEEGDS